jgi:ligand-binding sensor domain-containing protein
MSLVSLSVQQRCSLKGIWGFLRPSLLSSFLLVVVPFLSGIAGPARGLDPGRAISQFAHRAWTKGDGLPQNSVLAIAQTFDGYLWFGTMEGLARFDGRDFRVYNVRNTPEFKVHHISSLLADQDSTLWIGTAGGGALALKNGSFHPLKGEKAVSQAYITDFYRDSNGALWVASNMGLMLVQKDSVRRIFSTADGIPYTMAECVESAPDGKLIVTTKKGIFALEGDCFVPYQPLEQLQAHPLCMYVDRNSGELWLGTYQNGVFCLREGILTHYDVKDGLASNTVTRIFKDQRGSLWAGTLPGGLNRIVRGAVATYGSRDGLSGDEVTSLFEDREGNLWVGVSTGGVNRFVNSKFTTYKIGTTATQNMVWTLWEDRDGTVFAGNAEGEIHSLQGDKFRPYPGIKNPLEGMATSYCRDHAGSLWIGTSKGLYRFSGGTAKHYPIGYVRTLSEDGSGRLWIGLARGLYVFSNGKLEESALSPPAKEVDVRFVFEDRGKNVWIGTRGEGLLRAPKPNTGVMSTDLKGLRRMWATGKEGFGSSWVSSIFEDADGTIWATGYNAGILVIQNDSVSILGFDKGIPEYALHNVIDDGLGNLWLSTNNGVYRASKDDVLRVLSGKIARLPYAAFGTSDGMTSDECNGGFFNSAFKGTDGRIWFPTVSGVIMVNPAVLSQNDVPPRVAIARVSVDRQDVTDLLNPELPPGEGDLEFQFAGLSFSSPDHVKYKFMLQGYNADWVDADSRREAYYTNISPGTYTFRVEACNADGVWSEAGASYAFTLAPHFHQTIWFYLLCALGALGVVAGVFVLYRRDQNRALDAAQLESKLAQAQLQVLEMQIQPHFLFNTLNGIMVLIREDPEKAGRMIARLSELLRMTLERRGVQEVPLQKEIEFVERYLQIEMIRFEDRLTVHEDICNQLRDALVPNMVLQPLVENAIRHGVARRRGQARIDITARRENGSLVLSVRDNGMGLSADATHERKEGIGLSNIRARLRQLYGDAHAFVLASPEGGGVDARLTIPFHLSQEG